MLLSVVHDLFGHEKQGNNIFIVVVFILKGGNLLDWLDHMNAAIEYIETHLADDISYDRAAQIACCSTYHFQRMFSYITGIPLSEYIRRRRLTLAAFELQAGNCKVIDAALKYGYESPEAFSRAFKKLHDVMALLAAYRVEKQNNETLEAYLQCTAFAGASCEVASPDAADTAGFAAFLRRYTAALPTERAAGESLL